MKVSDDDAVQPKPSTTVTSSGKSPGSVGMPESTPSVMDTPIGSPPSTVTVALGDVEFAPENVMGDSYHVQMTHRSVFEVGIHPNQAKDFTSAGARNGIHIDAGNGTTGLARQSPEGRGYPKEMADQFRETLSPLHREILFDGEDQFWPTRAHLFPNFSLLCAGARISEEELEKSLSDISRSSMAALDELWSPQGGGDQVALIDTIEDPAGADPEFSLEQTELNEALAEAIARLPEREKLVVTLYYYEELTLREIGEVLGVTESRVSQLHTKAILRLKARLAGAPTRAALD